MRSKTKIFSIPPNNIPLSEARIIVSEPFLQESYFQRSVICMIEHDEEKGSMGFVLNHITKYILNTLIDDINVQYEIPIYCGGPVATDQLYFIHTLGSIIPNSVPIAPGIYVGGSFDAIIMYINTHDSIDDRIRFFVGYSGWSKSQLSEEVEKNIWAVSNTIDSDNVLYGDGDEYWKRVVESMGEKYRPWLMCPKDLFYN